MKARTRYTPAQRQAALDLYLEHGAAVAGEKTGIKPETIRAWASKNGLGAFRSEKTRAAVEAKKLSYEEYRAEMLGLLEQVATTGARKALEMVRDGDGKLSEVVGAFTRAIHDIALLEGRATERTEQVGTVDAEIQRLLDQLPTQPEHQEVPS